MVQYQASYLKLLKRTSDSRKQSSSYESYYNPSKQTYRGSREAPEPKQHLVILCDHVNIVIQNLFLSSSVLFPLLLCLHAFY